MNTSRISRSFLFVPGDRPERFAKAAASGAHEIILDLEDAVAPASKPAARDAVANWLAQGHAAVVRINSIDTPWYQEDLAMLQACAGAGLMLPKAEPASMSDAAGRLAGRQRIGLVETVAGYSRLRELAAVAGLTCLAFGSVDFSLESGIADEGEALTAVRTQVVLESIIAGLRPPVDGVSVELTDDGVIAQHARRSRQLGYGGKLCIHPRQVAGVNAAFAPTPAELDWARRVVTAFEASAGAAVALDGKMIDRPVVERARRILADS